MNTTTTTTTTTENDIIILTGHNSPVKNIKSFPNRNSFISSSDNLLLFWSITATKEGIKNVNKTQTKELIVDYVIISEEEEEEEEDLLLFVLLKNQVLLYKVEIEDNGNIHVDYFKSIKLNSSSSSSSSNDDDDDDVANCISINKNYIIVGTDKGIYIISTSTLKKEFIKRPYPVTCCAINSINSIECLFIASTDDCIQCYTITVRKDIQLQYQYTLRTRNTVLFMQLNTKSNLLMSHSMGDNCVYVWDISNSVVSSANSNSNSKEDEEVLMVDQTTQRLFKVCLGSYSSSSTTTSSSLRIIRGSMNSDLLTFGSSDCTVCVWDLYLNDGMEAKLLYKLYGHMGVVNCTEFISTPEENLMVVLSGGDDGLIYAGRLEQQL